MNTHSCIKCKTQYDDEEVDAYYCASCVVEKNKIAAEIDARMATRPKREYKSTMQQYDEQAITFRGRKFLKVDMS